LAENRNPNTQTPPFQDPMFLPIDVLRFFWNLGWGIWDLP
jgi:hypothetical protein